MCPTKGERKKERSEPLSQKRNWNRRTNKARQVRWSYIKPSKRRNILLPQLIKWMVLILVSRNFEKFFVGQFLPPPHIFFFLHTCLQTTWWICGLHLLLVSIWFTVTKYRKNNLLNFKYVIRILYIYREDQKVSEIQTLHAGSAQRK